MATTRKTTAVSSNSIHEMDGRLGAVEADLNFMRSEFTDMRTEMKAWSVDVSKAIESIRFSQAKATSLPQMLQGALTTLGIIVILVGFNTWTISAQTAATKATTQNNMAAIEKLYTKQSEADKSLTVLRAAMEATQSDVQRANRWLEKRHERVNAFYEKQQLKN